MGPQTLSPHVHTSQALSLLAANLSHLSLVPHSKPNSLPISLLPLTPVKPLSMGSQLVSLVPHSSQIIPNQFQFTPVKPQFQFTPVRSHSLPSLSCSALLPNQFTFYPFHRWLCLFFHRWMRGSTSQSTTRLRPHRCGGGGLWAGRFDARGSFGGRIRAHDADVTHGRCVTRRRRRSLAHR